MHAHRRNRRKTILRRASSTTPSTFLSTPQLEQVAANIAVVVVDPEEEGEKKAP
jgi:hypothetical protein